MRGLITGKSDTLRVETPRGDVIHVSAPVEIINLDDRGEKNVARVRLDAAAMRLLAVALADNVRGNGGPSS